MVESGFGPGWRLPPSPIGLPSSWGSCRPFQGTREEGHKEILCRANRNWARGYQQLSIHCQKAPESEQALPYALPLTRRHASKQATPLAPSPTCPRTSEQGMANNAKAPLFALLSTLLSHKRASTIVRSTADSLLHQWASTVIRPAADLSLCQQAKTAVRPAANLLSRQQALRQHSCGRQQAVLLSLLQTLLIVASMVARWGCSSSLPPHRRLIVAPAGEHRCPTHQPTRHRTSKQAPLSTPPPTCRHASECAPLSALPPTHRRAS